MTIRRIGRGERVYPPLLARIPDPPPSLWVRGDADSALLADPGGPLQQDRLRETPGGHGPGEAPPQGLLSEQGV